jgi:putative membrane protein
VKSWTGLEKALFAAFLFWSACGLIFTLGKIYPENVEAWRVPAFLRVFVLLCLRAGDPVLILLAFANTHLHAARQWSPAIARRWALLVLVAALIVETVGVRTGFPFGAYRYTDRFGPMLGLVPFVIPLAWHVVVTNALFLARRCTPQASRAIHALITGAICTGYDAVLEPFATRAKHYWNWAEGRVPLENYLAWFVISALMAAFLAPRPARIQAPGDPRPSVLLAVMLLIFIAGAWRG